MASSHATTSVLPTSLSASKTHFHILNNAKTLDLAFGAPKLPKRLISRSLRVMGSSASSSKPDISQGLYLSSLPKLLVFSYLIQRVKFVTS